jgi:hypothetical protein
MGTTPPHGRESQAVAGSSPGDLQRRGIVLDSSSSSEELGVLGGFLSSSAIWDFCEETCHLLTGLEERQAKRQKVGPRQASCISPAWMALQALADGGAFFVFAACNRLAAQ